MRRFPFRVAPNGRISAKKSLAAEAIMAMPNLKKMDVGALLALRGKVDAALRAKRLGLEQQLTRLGAKAAGISIVGHGRGSSLRGRKIAPKYRDKAGNTWSGRGAMAGWLKAAVKAGGKLEDYLIAKTALRKTGPKRKTKRA
jgi:DNA-binding protein H-NS